MALGLLEYLSLYNINSFEFYCILDNWLFIMICGFPIEADSIDFLKCGESKVYVVGDPSFEYYCDDN